MKIRHKFSLPLILLALLCGCSTPMKEGSRHDDLNHIKSIVSNNRTKIDEKNEHGSTFIHIAVDNGNIEVLKYLVSQGANVNVKDNYGKTPLQAAVNKNNLEMVEYLISHGADVNVKDYFSRSPLHDAAIIGNIETVQILISHGAQINAKDNMNKSPLHHSVEKGHKEITQYLLSKNAAVNTKDVRGKYPLHYAASFGDPEQVKDLISKGAVVNARDKFDLSPLHDAVDYEQLEIVIDLLSQGADVNAKGAYIFSVINRTLGCTPLHIAAYRGNLKVLKYLISQGADVNLKNNEEQNALDLAKMRGNQEVVVFLESSEELARLSNASKTVAGTPLEQAPPKESIKTKSSPHPDIDFGSYSALIIGNNNYQYLPPLKTAQNDAKEVAETLKDKYGFKVELLLDANRSDILLALNNLRWNLTNRDNLLIFYAGHGWLDKEADEGYWLPVDAEKDNMLAWISNSSITASLRALKAKHVLIVADSCYSGKLARGVHIIERNPGYLSRLSQKRARCVISSGGLEPVIDSGGDGRHSIFASAFLNTLKENPDIMDSSQLFNKLRRPVMLNSDQTPEYSDIRKAGHEGGEFLFVSID